MIKIMAFCGDFPPLLSFSLFTCGASFGRKPQSGFLVSEPQLGRVYFHLSDCPHIVLLF